MEYQEYLRRSQQAAQLVKESHLKEAREAFYALVLSDISEIDKAAICVSLANVYDRMGDTDEALNWYEKGVATEAPYCRYETAEKKAEYLSIIGRNKDAVAIYEVLMKQPFVSESDRERMRKMIQTLLGRVMREWK